MRWRLIKYHIKLHILNKLVTYTDQTALTTWYLPHFPSTGSEPVGHDTFTVVPKDPRENEPAPMIVCKTQNGVIHINNNKAYHLGALLHNPVALSLSSSQYNWRTGTCKCYSWVLDLQMYRIDMTLRHGTSLVVPRIVARVTISIHWLFGKICHSLLKDFQTDLLNNFIFVSVCLRYSLFFHILVYDIWDYLLSADAFLL